MRKVLGSKETETRIVKKEIQQAALLTTKAFVLLGPALTSVTSSVSLFSFLNQLDINNLALEYKLIYLFRLGSDRQGDE